MPTSLPSMDFLMEIFMGSESRNKSTNRIGPNLTDCHTPSPCLAFFPLCFPEGTKAVLARCPLRLRNFILALYRNLPIGTSSLVQKKLKDCRSIMEWTFTSDWSQVYYWEVNWPRFFSNRDYVCARRAVIIDDDDPKVRQPKV